MTSKWTDIFFITGNAWKFTEAQSVFPVLKQKDIDLKEIQSMSPQDVILEKLKEASWCIDWTLIVEDTSLFINGLWGFPGPFIKFFLKANSLDRIAELASLSWDDTAKAVCVVWILAKEKDWTLKTEFHEAELKWKIVASRWTNWFWWDAIFQPEGSLKTFSEMSDSEKESFSMRTEVFKKVKKSSLIKYTYSLKNF